MKPLNYDTLAALPLFMGMDGAMLSSFYDEARPAVTIVRQGAMIARRGEECRTLTLVMDGSITVTSSDPHGICEIEEHMPANGVIEPQRLFGLHTTYMRTYTAASPCRVMRLPKQTVVSQLLVNEVFRFNFMNLVCSTAQQFESRFAPAAPYTLEGRLAMFVLFKSLRPVGRKVLRVKMTDLATMLCTSRLTLSRMLHSLSSRGLIEFSRRHIVIPSLENLTATVK